MTLERTLTLLRSQTLFGSVFLLSCLVVFTNTASAGRLYVLNQINGAANQIYCFNVNETSGALTLTSGFPVSSGGNGVNSTHHESIAIDRANLRLYVLNRGSNNVGAFSINPSTGELSPLPFHPISLTAGNWATIAVHPSGSPLIVGDGDSTPDVLSYKITNAAAIFAIQSSNSAIRPFSSEFSRDGFFFYVGGLLGNSFSGYGVNPTTGSMNFLQGISFDSGALLPNAYATDSQGRLFTANFAQNQLRVFTTNAGVPTQVTGSPFTSNLTEAVDGVLHPSEKFYYVADRAANHVGVYQINGTGAATTLTGNILAGSGGLLTLSLAVNNAGTYLYSANGDSRNLTTYRINLGTGTPQPLVVQPVNTLGSTGRLTGIAYLPDYYMVSNTSDSGGGSLRQAVQDANDQTGGIIIFDPQVFALPKTISLSGGELNLISNVEIVGPGANILTVRNTLGSSGVFKIGQERVNVKLSGMTITGGNSQLPGGGIFSDALESKVMIDRCTISGNSTTIFGGGIFNSGVMNIINSTISGNTSSNSSVTSGGILNQGKLFITNTTISDNVGTGAQNNAGGIWNDGGDVTLTNSTVTNNSAPGGVGGVLTSGGVVIVRNTIIAGNRNHVADVLGNFLSNGFNLIGDRGSATGFNQTGDQTGTAAAVLDPKLVKVLSYKGGTTPVHALLPNSPAIDKGSRVGLQVDQRLLNRPFDNLSIPNTLDGADIGAYERHALESLFTPPFDFDGDGKTDISIFRPSVGEWWVNRSSTGATFATQFGSGADKITPGDFTGDGKTDIAFWRPSNGFWFVLRSDDFSFFSFPFGSSGDIPAPADFDGDSKTDAAVFRPASATWFIMNSFGGNTVNQFGSNGDVPVPGDYDGDGKMDVAIYRPSNGQWWVNRSFAGVVATTFGGGSDKPVQGDYTGDGKMDIAFWRPSTGEWFVLRSEDFSFFSFRFGVNGDIPAPGDYDGDGKNDATVFRPGSATWFSQLSTAGTLIVPFGANGDRPVPSAFVP